MDSVTDTNIRPTDILTAWNMMMNYRKADEWNEIEKKIGHTSMTLDTEEKISSLVEEIISRNKDEEYIYLVKHCDPMLMYRYGIVPYSTFSQDNPQFIRYMMSSDEQKKSPDFISSIEFWDQSYTRGFLENLHKHPICNLNLQCTGYQYIST